MKDTGIQYIHELFLKATLTLPSDRIEIPTAGYLDNNEILPELENTETYNVVLVCMYNVVHSEDSSTYAQCYIHTKNFPSNIIVYNADVFD